MKEREK